MDKFRCSDSLAIPKPDGQRLTPLEYIGAGANGFVLKVSDKSNNYSALKIVPVIVTSNEEKAARIKRESRFYQYLENTQKIPNLAKATAWWSVENVEKSGYLRWNKALRKRLNAEVLDYPSQLIKKASGESGKVKLCVHVVQMDYYTSGNLRTWLECYSDKCEETYPLRIKLFCDIVSAVDFLHERGLMHRDICPNNIFLAKNYQRLHAVLGDFDSIVSCGEQALWPLTKGRETFTRLLGTDPYAAPEIDGDDYDKQCDLFSLGVIALNLFFNILDNKGLRQAIYKICEKDVFPTCIVADKSTLWVDIVKAQLSRTPQRRLSSCELLKLVAKENWTREESYYLLDCSANALIRVKDFRFGTESLLSRFSRFSWISRSRRSSQPSLGELPQMPEPRRRGLSVAGCAGKMYVLGGYEADTHYEKASSLVQQYDTQTGWQDWSPMLEERFSCGAAVLGDGLFAVGGRGVHYSVLNSAEECDLVTGRWTTVAPMTAARCGVGVAPVGNLLFAVGGWDGSSYLKSVEWYDARVGRWTIIAPMHKPRIWFGCAVLGDRLYVAGGCIGSWECTTSMECLDLRACRWTHVRDMGAPRVEFPLAALNGQLLAAGGFTSGWKLLDTVEVYDDRRDAWSPLDVRLPRVEWSVGCVLEE